MKKYNPSVKVNSTLKIKLDILGFDGIPQTFLSGIKSDNNRRLTKKGMQIRKLESVPARPNSTCCRHCRQKEIYPVSSNDSARIEVITMEITVIAEFIYSLAERNINSTDVPFLAVFAQGTFVFSFIEMVMSLNGWSGAFYSLRRLWLHLPLTVE